MQVRGQPEGTTVVCVSPHPLVLSALRTKLTRLGVKEICEVIPSARSIEVPDADMLILDVSNPADDPAETINALDVDLATVRAVAVSHSATPARIHAVFALGFSGFYQLRASLAELRSVLIRAYAGQVALDSQSAATYARAQLLATRVLASAPDPDLSDEDVELLGCIASGMSNLEVAEDWGIAPSVVRSKVSRLLAKTGTPNRAALVAWALRSQVIT